VSLPRLLGRTKLYWGLAAIFLAGVVFSPYTSKGANIFLSYGNLADVLRQVSITGIVAVGMTLVILTAGIDLSVGSVLAFGSVLSAMLLTQPGWTPAAVMGVPGTTAVVFVATFLLVRFVGRGIARGPPQAPIGRREEEKARPLADLWLPAAAGLAAALTVATLCVAQVPGKFGVVGVLLVVPCVGLLVGALSGAIIVYGRLQPFIVTLAMMVGALGAARLTAGQDNAVLPVYTGSNAVAAFDGLRSVVLGILPVPGLFFLGALAVFVLLLNGTAFGRYVYAIGGNEDATRLSGVPVGRVKVATYALSGMLAALAGVLYVAQYRQGKPDAGAGLELDAIAAVAIGGTSLVGGKGGLAGTFVGVLIFGLLGNILQLNNITSNLQLLLKGVIIVLAVLLQERDFRLLVARMRGRGRGTATGTAVTGRGANITDGQTSNRETVHETP
jgi:simple sugar transport system permease protein